MMHYITRSLTIISWVGSYGSRYMCILFTGNEKEHKTEELTIEEANLLQWQLMREGATKTADYNPYTPDVYTRYIRLTEIF